MAIKHKTSSGFYVEINKVSVSNSETSWLLKNSVMYEMDIIAPIGEIWYIERGLLSIPMFGL